MPGDPFTFLSSEEDHFHMAFSQEDILRYKAYYGLDQPLSIQYYRYVTGLVKGDLGYSIFYKDTVLSVILSRLPWTLAIVFVSVFFSALIGTILGSYSALKRGFWMDKALYQFMLFLSEIPSFIIAFLLLLIFSAGLGWFPLSGGKTHFVEFQSSLDQIKDLIHHSFLPLLALTLSQVGSFYLISRNSMVDVLKKAYIKTAKAKGLGAFRVTYVHALRNSLLPIITRFFLSLGGAMGGAILVENVFKYPGIGSLMRQAVHHRDYPLIQGIFLFMAFFVMVMNIFADTLYKKIDPRTNL